MSIIYKDQLVDTNRYALCKQVLIDGLIIDDLIYAIYEIYAMTVNNQFGHDECHNDAIIEIEIHPQCGVFYSSRLCPLYATHEEEDRYYSDDFILIHIYCDLMPSKSYDNFYHISCYYKKYGAVHIYRNSYIKQKWIDAAQTFLISNS